IIATGGGAFMDPETRETIKAASTSIWLRADPEVLYQRTKRSRTRPLIATEDPRAKLIALAELRYPVYAEADITVDTGNERLDATVQKVADIIAQNTNSGA
ncbi:MAG: shikimate kinase, partial [Rhodospirillales bacterium]